MASYISALIAGIICFFMGLIISDFAVKSHVCKDFGYTDAGIFPGNQCMVRYRDGTVIFYPFQTVLNNHK